MEQKFHQTGTFKFAIGVAVGMLLYRLVMEGELTSNPAVSGSSTSTRW